MWKNGYLFINLLPSLSSIRAELVNTIVSTEVRFPVPSCGHGHNFIRLVSILAGALMGFFFLKEYAGFR
jgi:hypothetical protein